jgi:Heavy-metal resistance
MVAPWRRTSGVLPTLFFLSLGANLFFAGWLLAGMSIRHYFQPPVAMGHFEQQMRASLTANGAAIMDEAFENIRNRFATPSIHIKMSRERIKDTLSAQPFNPAAFVAASKDARAERERDRNEADEKIAKAIAQLSIEDRLRLVELRQRERPDGTTSFTPFH